MTRDSNDKWIHQRNLNDSGHSGTEIAKLSHLKHKGEPGAGGLRRASCGLIQIQRESESGRVRLAGLRVGT
jgi:hypothetical protein